MGTDAIKLHRGPGVSFMWPIDWILDDPKATILKKPLSKSRMAMEAERTREIFTRMKNNSQFSKLISAIRKEKKIVPQEFNALLNEARRKDRDFQFFRDSRLKRKPSQDEVRKKSSDAYDAYLDVSRYSSRLFWNELHAIRRTLNKDDMNLPDSVDEILAYYILTGDESFPLRERCQVSVASYESGEHKIVIQITTDATREDINRIWPNVEFFQENSTGSMEKKASPKGSRARRDCILDLHRKGYGPKAIRSKLQVSGYPDISLSGISKIIKRATRKIRN